MAQQYESMGLLPSGVLQPYGKSALKYGIGQLGKPIDVGAMTAKVAGPTGFQQKAHQRLADMYGLGAIQRDATGMVTGFTGGTGVASYQPYLDQIQTEKLLDPAQGYQAFMSPYQKEIIDTTMQEYDIQAGRGRQAISDRAFTAGAFGGGRHGVEMGQYQSESDRNRAALLAGLYGQGYNQALTQQQQQLANLQGMTGLEPGLQAQGVAALEAVGAQDQALEQQKLNQLAEAQRLGYQLPMDRITDVANIYGTVAGAMPGSPTQKFTPSPMVQGIGGFANMYSTLGGWTGGGQQRGYTPMNQAQADLYGGVAYNTPF
tara:strand:+ start:3538 stop:4488 length:951 start_codon:yes stop_codon:yes gene_type:complete